MLVFKIFLGPQTKSWTGKWFRLHLFNPCINSLSKYFLNILPNIENYTGVLLLLLTVSFIPELLETKLSRP